MSGARAAGISTATSEMAGANESTGAAGSLIVANTIISDKAILEAEEAVQGILKIINGRACWPPLSFSKQPLGTCVHLGWYSREGVVRIVLGGPTPSGGSHLLRVQFCDAMLMRLDDRGGVDPGERRAFKRARVLLPSNPPRHER